LHCPEPDKARKVAIKGAIAWKFYRTIEMKGRNKERRGGRRDLRWISEPARDSVPIKSAVK
jgi:hypothetical protein